MIGCGATISLSVQHLSDLWINSRVGARLDIQRISMNSPLTVEAVVQGILVLQPHFEISDLGLIEAGT